MGIGHPGDKDRVLSYVLANFGQDDLAWAKALCEACAAAAPLLAEGFDERYQAEVMRLAPAEKADPRQPGRDAPA